MGRSHRRSTKGLWRVRQVLEVRRLYNFLTRWPVVWVLQCRVYSAFILLILKILHDLSIP